MKNIKKVGEALLEILIILGILYVVYLWITHVDEPIKEEPKHIKIIEKFDEVKEDYSQEILVLKFQKDSLQKSLDEKLIELDTLQKKVSDLSNNIKMKIRQKPKDTTQVIVQCEELKKDVEELIIISEQKDLACNETIDNLIEINTTNEAIILTSIVRINTTDSLLEQSIAQQQELQKKLNIEYKKTLKKEKQNKILSAGFLILSGVTAVFILR